MRAEHIDSVCEWNIEHTQRWKSASVKQVESTQSGCCQCFFFSLFSNVLSARFINEYYVFYARFNYYGI